jgi:hypothetical protein
VVQYLKGGEKNEKDCFFDDFIVGVGFRDGRVPPSSPPPETLL